MILRKYTKFIWVSLIFAIGGFFMSLSIRKSNMQYSLDPSLKLQQFGLVSEDGVMQVGLIEKNSDSDYSVTKLKNIENAEAERNSSPRKQFVKDTKEERLKKNAIKKGRQSRKTLNSDGSDKEQYKELNEYKKKIRGNAANKFRNKY